MGLNEAFLGLGSNLGDPVSNIREALGLLGRLARSMEVSRLYRTTPQGFSDQPDFVNAACRLWTDLDPFELLDAALRIERAIGRHRTFANAPRSLDIDVLMYGRQVLQGPPLTIPHPRMHNRAFVLRPLLDIAPGLVHPFAGKTVQLMWDEIEMDGELISQVS
ncbi:MAG: 2-amino-4-hydroxy-6-hydroxymethyldihydropteridine diphosphokinase [SAR202 cluster bacterium Casp-Chloro-G4]|nr:2-amino-4-hydroxy-6-hydroxymethyldihydropteridine diphosphokinase [Chloroflexota bacterium]MDA1228768.1 2-amino-4-hydroxy-6-hydroxymethyldihydropteridine diphosphokinase [Chloroflexota bacterium]PKB61267.1 MAG: 2-amino-4-hydroxy-6-hydroxymethyldihydropteridine diphosphokinase [SAR202 cluster bacterium Casp-Chloro-G4]